ncbi:MAG TPA: HlyD family efflux transporter periplasmic adaptor subunit [Tepidisphaeraceae bacterium]|nr:HlyD family efflux transporter periplasmic adaptor subunit [Tepidisphaeraceae bacterium]
MASQEVVESSGSEQGQETGHGQSGQRSRLVQRLLTATDNLPQFVNDLVTAQAVTVAGTEAAGFIIERAAPAGEDAPGADESGFLLRPIAHVRPDQSTPETRAAAISAFQDILRPCVVQAKDGAIEIGGDPSQSEPQFCLVTLLRNEGAIIAVSAVITRCMNLERARQRLMSMQLVAGYFELYSLRRGAEQARTIAQSHQHVLQLATAVGTADGFQAAATGLCNELATRSGATRVALGWVKGRNCKVQALSNTEQFDKKQELVVQLQKAMEECIDQDEPVCFDPTGESSTENVTREALALSRTQGGSTVLSLPLRKGTDVVGVVTLEYPPGQPLGPNVITGLGVAVDLVAPQLHDRYVNDRWLITKAGLSAKSLAEKAVGPKYMISKAIIIASIGLLLFVTFYKPMYRIAAPFQFAAIEKRTISAPFEGQIEEVYKKPGEPVRKGDPLLKLRTDELELKRNEAEKQAYASRKEAEKAYSASLTDRTKTADYVIHKAHADEAQAQYDLYDLQIRQALIVSPIDGEVLKGDLADKVGAKVSPQDGLMEVGDLRGLKVRMNVQERDIQRVTAGSNGWFSTNANPSNEYPLRVTKIVPLGEPKDQSNTFEVEGVIDRDSDRWNAEMAKQTAGWLPGMVGEARVETQPEPLIWIWTHRLVDWLRLKLWM